jgi:hypothetical protein
MILLNTPAQRRRFQRDLLISLGHHYGFTEEVLGQIFNLERTSVSSIILKLVEDGLGDPTSEAFQSYCKAWGSDRRGGQALSHKGTKTL